LVQRFVKRQQLPFEVMQKYRPHLLDPTQRRPSKEYARATQIGHWGQDNEWGYYLHGVGCRLTHTINGEVIDWDASNLSRFDFNWFVHWLAWFLKQNPEDAASATILASISEQGEALKKMLLVVLEELCNSGKLRRSADGYHRYELTI